MEQLELVQTMYNCATDLVVVSQSSYSNGTIDEVAIYPYALTPQQIQSHYFAKSVPPNSYASAIIASKPTNYWQLDEEGGLVANDIVGGKHGTISGGVTLGQVGIGKSMSFDGVDDKIVTLQDVILPIPSTIECWAKWPTPYTWGHAAVVSTRGVPNGFMFGIFNHTVICYSDDSTPVQIGDIYSNSCIMASSSYGS